MNRIKSFIKKYFNYFSYFYSHLGYRVFVSLSLSLFVGALDGLGLAMFLPLLQMVDGEPSASSSKEMGSLSFLLEGLAYFNIPLTLVTILLIILFFFSCKGIMKFLEGYFRVVYQQYFIKNIRLKNADLLAAYSYNAFSAADSGRIQNTFSGEVQRVNNAYKNYFMAVQAMVLVVVYLTLAFLSNPQFALIVIVGGVLTNFIFRNLYKLTKQRSKEITAQMHSFQGLLIQKVSNFKYLKATGFIFKYAKKLKERIEEIEYSQRKIGLLAALLQGIREPMTILIVISAIFIQVIYLEKPLGLIILSLLFLYRSLSSLMTIQNYWNNFLGLSGSLENMTEFTNELRTNEDIFKGENYRSLEKSVKIDNVDVSINERDILKQISFDIERNKTLAIVGESGSGKTTLINVLVGLIKPTRGNVYIDSKPLCDIDLRSFQSKIGYITQEAVIFSDSIFNNVTFWSDKTTENVERFYNALKKAAIFDFVCGLK
ncbi:MAG: ABC transporter ATP-binding protein, partial [Fulvivirga sp.]